MISAMPVQQQKPELENIIAKAMAQVHIGTVSEVMDWGAQATFNYTANDVRHTLTAFLQPEYSAEDGHRITVAQGQKVIIMPLEKLREPVLSAHIEGIAVEPKRYLSSLSAKLTDYEKRYSTFIETLPMNDSPYNSLLDLYNASTQELAVWLFRCKNNLSAFGSTEQAQVLALGKQYNLLKWRMTETLMHIGNILDSADGTDQNIFTMNLMLDTHDIPILTKKDEVIAQNTGEIFAVAKETGILIPPAGYEGDVPNYAFNDFITGRRRILITHFDKDTNIHGSLIDQAPIESIKAFYTNSLKLLQNGSSADQAHTAALNLFALNEYLTSEGRERAPQTGIDLKVLALQKDAALARYLSIQMINTGEILYDPHGQYMLKYSADGVAHNKNTSGIPFNLGKIVISDRKYKVVMITQKFKPDLERATYMALAQALPSLMKEDPTLKKYLPLNLLTTSTLPSPQYLNNVRANLVQTFSKGEFPVYLYQIGRATK